MTRARDGVGRRLQDLLVAGTVGDLSDGRLLERFLSRDGELAEAAFASLMQRHGPMVWRVCRSILADPNDADDAFQATFLVMVRRSRSLWVRDSLGPWLHQVARRTALRARKLASQRRLRERAAAGDRSSLVEERPLDDLAVIHEEIDRLPGRYRAVVVVCLLEGLPDEQAAIRLGCPPGTIHSRLARGRERLRRSLARRGVAPGLALAGSRISTEAASSVVPPRLVEATLIAASRLAAGGIRSAPLPGSVAALLEGVSRMFWLAHAKVGLAAVMLGGAVVATALSPQEGGRPAPEAAIRPEPPAPAPPPVQQAAARSHPAWSTVKIRISNDGAGGGLGMNLGTIIANTRDETLILTCAHNLGPERPDGESRKITVLYPDPTGADLSQDRPSRDLDVAVSGELVARDDDRDLAVLRIKAGRVLPSVRLAPPGRRLGEGQELLRTERTEDETTNLRYTTVIQTNATLLNSGKKDYLATCCLGLPMPGDSGSPLLLRSDDPAPPSWEVVGVCNASVPQENKGYYASPESIHAFLDANGLTALMPGDAPEPRSDSEPVVAAPSVESPPTTAPALLPNEPSSPIVRIGIEGKTPANGFGIIVWSNLKESIVLTAGRLFDAEDASQRVDPKAFSRRIAVTLAASSNMVYTEPAPAEFTLPGEVVDYDLARNVGLIRIRPGRLLPVAAILPREWPLAKQSVLTAYKLDPGGHLAARNLKVVNHDVRGEVDGVTYTAIECDRRPKRDELGMPLDLGLVEQGKPQFVVAGVCNYSDASGAQEGTGLYASPVMIQHILEANGYASAVPAPETPPTFAPAMPFRRLPKPDAAPPTPDTARPETAVGDAPRLDRVERRVDDMDRRLDRILEALEKPQPPPR